MTMHSTKAPLKAISRPDLSRPDADSLYRVAEAQAGHFTTLQAADCGYSPQLLSHHTRGGRFRRVRYGIYRLVHFPASPQEPLMVLWLWTECAGVFSHETALTAHDLAQLLPSRTHITLPTSWRPRRLRVPDGVQLHYADLPETATQRLGGLPHTTPDQTLTDCAADRIAPDVLQRARDLNGRRRPRTRRLKTNGNWRVW